MQSELLCLCVNNMASFNFMLTTSLSLNKNKSDLIFWNFMLKKSVYVCVFFPISFSHSSID